MYHLCVGTFDVPLLYVVSFDPITNALEIVSSNPAPGPHSWLSLSKDHTRLYATCWTEPPGLAAYELSNLNTTPTISLINTITTASRSGYCCSSASTVYTAGGASGEVFRIDPTTGGFEQEVQKLDFVDRGGKQVDDGGVMDFGGLRHGAHSADLSKDGKVLYVADIGRNCIFVHQVDPTDGTLTLTDKNIAPRPTDGPRHVTPHPNGEYVYSLQEHTSMVDVFELMDGKTLEWRQGVKIIPTDLSPSLFWADEVRLSSSQTHLFASTRGLLPSQKGYIAAFPLFPSGLLASLDPLSMYETPTSGGWANAIEPCFEQVELSNGGGKGELLVLTDESEGWVFMITWTETRGFEEVARLKLPAGKAATAVWL